MHTAQKKILVVDDSPIELKLMTRILTQAGYETIMASSGAQALQLAETDLPDLVILDINMPLLDGYEVCQRLKEGPSTHLIPVVLYSERDQVVDVLRGIEAGAESFITKGAQKNDLLERIQSSLPGSTTPDRMKVLVDLGELDQAAKHKSAAPVARLLAEAFASIVRQRINIALGFQTTMLLSQRAKRVAAFKHHALSSQVEFGDEGYPFDLKSVGSASARDVIEGFKTFASEFLRPMVKLADAKLYGARDVNELVSALRQLARSFLDAYAQLGSRPVKEPSTPRAGTEAEAHPESGPADASLPPGFIPGPPVVRFALDANETLSTFEDAAARYLGYNKASLVGQPVSTILPDTSMAALRDLLTKVKQDGKAEAEIELKRSDGELVPVRWQSSALYDKQGKLVLSQHVGHVVPDDEETRKKLQEYAHLIVGKDEALERKEKELKAFIRNVSHDLKQPLQVVINLAQLLTEEYSEHLDESGREYLATVQAYALRMREMIGQLVNLSRIAVITPPKDGTDLSAVLQEVRTSLDPVLKERKARFEVVDRLPTVKCDPAQIRTVFTHLVDNATKFNDKPQPSVQVGCSCAGPGGFTLYVRDNGMGIEERSFEKVFEVFQRLHPPEQFPGQGVGLTFCKRIVEAHGGKIWLESTPGTGSTFFFTLPA